MCEMLIKIAAKAVSHGQYVTFQLFSTFAATLALLGADCSLNGPLADTRPTHGRPERGTAWRMTAARYQLSPTCATDSADIAKVQEWLRHANIATTRISDHRRTRPEDSPTVKVSCY